MLYRKAPIAAAFSSPTIQLQAAGMTIAQLDDDSSWIPDAMFCEAHDGWPILGSRRHAAAGAQMIAAQTTIADWIHLVRSEYLEIPGLLLTRNQVRRLWGLDAVMCDMLLEALLDARFLRRTPAGAYVRADGGAR
jgi:hypothetical protein